MTSVYSRLRLKKDNFHQFNSDFHKEKEMVDFRKWLLALAVVGLLLGVGSSAANAQSQHFVYMRGYRWRTQHCPRQRESPSWWAIWF